MLEDRKYNIIILNHHAQTPDQGGGVRHYELAKALSESGHKVSVVASSYENATREYYSPENTSIQQINDNFNFIRLKTTPAYASTFGRLINCYDYMLRASILDCFGCRPDVVIASSVHPLAWVAGYRLSRKYDAKFIVEVRDLWPLGLHEDFEGILRALVFKYLEGLESKYYNAADAIVTTAPFAYEYIEEKYGIRRDKIYHIPHGLDIDEFDSSASLSEEILDPGLCKVLDSYFCVTYTGSLSRSEGLSTFVQSAKYLKDLSDVKLVIVGSGNIQEQLERIVDEEDLSNVFMLPVQPRGSIPLTLKKSEILFCGLIDRKVFEYGISKNKFYDYMAAIKPIVFASSVRGSLIDIAECGITTKPGDPEEIANAIRYIHNNIDTVGKDYGTNGRIYVEQYHTVERIAEQFLEVIQSCFVSDPIEDSNVRR